MASRSSGGASGSAISLQHQDLRANLALRRQPGWLQQRVQADDAAHVRAASGQIQHTHATEAESDGSDAARVDLRQLLRGSQRRGDATCEQRPVLDQRRDQRRAFCVAGAALALAEHVEGEGCEPMPGEAARLALHELAPAAPLVRDQHRGQRARTRVVVAVEALERVGPSRYSISRSRIAMVAPPDRLLQGAGILASRLAP